MTRLPFFDHHTSFEAAEAEIRHAVSDCNCNLMRDTARILALESLGCDVFAVSLVDELAWERIVPDGGADTGPRFLNTSFATVGSRSRGFVECVLLKWPNVIFQSVYLDYYWLPDSVAWLQKGYMANNAGVIDNLIKMKEIGILARGFDVVLPVNTALVQCLEPLVKKLRANFAVHFISGDTEAIRPHHLAVQADSLIPPHVMSGVYCKNQQRQIDDMLGIKGSAAARALTILKRLVSGRTLARTPDLQDVRFLRLTPLPSDPLYIGPILCR
ncbi:hypothetical protein JKP88DRAFT_264719 [Tribonema minus]|uniref:Uncharacterized protein n=1 Tax=Tribonema minus TaxID=303371 RepID=A0A835YWD2_9STRA|nr:hypothetical protein JKP88DRAFT_264719 [Tribonema minus]